MKLCSTCGESKPQAEFSGTRRSCKSCRAAYYRKWQAANRAKLAEYQRQWVAKNPDKTLKYAHDWSARNPVKKRDATKKWAAANPGVQAAAAKRWQAANKTRVRAAGLRKRGCAVTAEDIAIMEQRAAGKCECCGDKFPSGKWCNAVDHCHDTGKPRGLLCGPCNKALGMLNEDLNRVEAMARYIRERCLPLKCAGW